MRPQGIVLPLVLLLIPILSLPSLAGAQGPDNVAASPTVTFEEAVRVALSNGREVHMAAQDVRIAVEGRTVASAGWLPRLDAGADYTALSEPPAAIFQGITVQTADKNIWRARVTAEQTIYDFGRTRSRVDQAGARTEAAERLEGATRERQALDVISAFLDAKRAGALRNVAEESLATAVDHLRVAKDRFEAGTVARNDVLAADVQVANA
ncbi:MAG: TolC family protein, partial [Actinomycetota bacterium]